MKTYRFWIVVELFGQELQEIEWTRLTKEDAKKMYELTSKNCRDVIREFGWDKQEITITGSLLA